MKEALDLQLEEELPQHQQVVVVEVNGYSFFNLCLFFSNIEGPR